MHASTISGLAGANYPNLALKPMSTVTKTSATRLFHTREFASGNHPSRPWLRHANHSQVPVFSIVHAVLLRPLPYRDPSRLVLTFDAPVHDKNTGFFVQYRDFQEWAKKNHSYESMAAATWARGPRFLLGRGAPRSILAVPVSLDFFAMLGVPPQLGRTFTRDDLSRGCTACWRILFGRAIWADKPASSAST
jgi:hypothetical protein